MKDYKNYIIAFLVIVIGSLINTFLLGGDIWVYMLGFVIGQIVGILISGD